jgi:hypothetical protein
MVAMRQTRPFMNNSFPGHAPSSRGCAGSEVPSPRLHNRRKAAPRAALAPAPGERTMSAWSAHESVTSPSVRPTASGSTTIGPRYRVHPAATCEVLSEEQGRSIWDAMTCSPSGADRAPSAALRTGCACVR